LEAGQSVLALAMECGACLPLPWSRRTADSFKESGSIEALDGPECAPSSKRGRTVASAESSAAADRFLRASGRRYAGMTRSSQQSARPFFFMQLADTQIGMIPRHEEAEKAQMRRAVSEVNRLRPAFAIVCGDLVDEWPVEETGRPAAAANPDRRIQQEKDFKEAMQLVDPSIPLLCLCGNHDIGDRPNAATIKRYTQQFGDDYYVFWCHGVKCIVINSQLLKDDQDAKDLREAHDRWLEAELEEECTSEHDCPAPSSCHTQDATSKACAERRMLVFSHIPPFISDPNEHDDYFALDRDTRLPILARMAKGGVKAWFAGHFHRNAGGVYRDAEGRQLEVVVTGAVGSQIKDKEGSDPLGKAGIGGFTIGEDVSGLRLVRVLPDRIEHEWKTFRELAEVQREHLAPCI